MLCCLPGARFAKAILVIFGVQFAIHLAAYYNDTHVNERILLIGNMLSLSVLFVMFFLWPLFKSMPGISRLLSLLSPYNWWRQSSSSSKPAALAAPAPVAVGAVNFFEPCNLAQWTKNLEALTRQAPANEFESMPTLDVYKCSARCRFSRVMMQAAYIDAERSPRAFREVIFIDHDDECRGLLGAKKHK